MSMGGVFTLAQKIWARKYVNSQHLKYNFALLQSLDSKDLKVHCQHQSVFTVLFEGSEYHCPTLADGEMETLRGKLDSLSLQNKLG